MNYHKIYDDLITSRVKLNRVRQLGVCYERHHIVPRCMGGDDGEENLILLTPKEHFVAHRLLSKMFPSVGALKIAMFMMCQPGSLSGNGIIVSSAVYEHCRLEAWRQRKLDAGHDDSQIPLLRVIMVPKGVSNRSRNIVKGRRSRLKTTLNMIITNAMAAHHFDMDMSYSRRNSSSPSIISSLRHPATGKQISGVEISTSGFRRGVDALCDLGYLFKVGQNESDSDVPLAKRKISRFRATQKLVDEFHLSMSDCALSYETASNYYGNKCGLTQSEMG